MKKFLQSLTDVASGKYDPQLRPIVNGAYDFFKKREDSNLTKVNSEDIWVRSPKSQDGIFYKKVVDTIEDPQWIFVIREGLYKATPCTVILLSKKVEEDMVEETTIPGFDSIQKNLNSVQVSAKEHQEKVLSDEMRVIIQKYSPSALVDSTESVLKEGKNTNIVQFYEFFERINSDIIGDKYNWIGSLNDNGVFLIMIINKIE